MPTHAKPYKGQCLCGMIQYEADEIGPRMAHCHCTMCRKFHGAAFSTFAEAKKSAFRWLTGEASLKTYLASNGTQRQFCEHCGSSLVFISSNDQGEWIEFALGTLDSDIDIKPDAHVFTQFKAPWHEIKDSLPQFAAGRSIPK
ncbi:GFA family protein [Janthinobacterium sp. B9-8]|uniref:GFA family protein n=1 Tax=Janthinobacterium sp. B9-8 TaxID=1236179 RepID=UPI00061D3AAB|nr:GFA family protein [Janthinobacterium sp. B9-8]AMC34287.1 ribulose phosphate epimerase [Janthinobacterium sp. B9-8]